MSPEEVEAAQRAIGHAFKDPALLALALTHASVSESRLQSNERLEFLGDSVLGLVVCRELFDRFPNLLEGELTKIKSAAVSRQTCATIAFGLGLHTMLTLGKGMKTGNQEVPSSLAAGEHSALLRSITASRLRLLIVLRLQLLRAELQLQLRCRNRYRCRHRR